MFGAGTTTAQPSGQNSRAPLNDDRNYGAKRAAQTLRLLWSVDRARCEDHWAVFLGLQATAQLAPVASPIGQFTKYPNMRRLIRPPMAEPMTHSSM
jgi:hypothetical protein